MPTEQEVFDSIIDYVNECDTEELISLFNHIFGKYYKKLTLKNIKKGDYDED